MHRYTSLLIWVAAFAASYSLQATEPRYDWSRDIELTPADLGIDKFTIRTDVPLGKLHVLTLVHEGFGPTSTRQIITYEPHEQIKCSILVFDRARFPFADQEVRQRGVRMKCWGGLTFDFPKGRVVSAGFVGDRLIVRVNDGEEQEREQAFQFRVTVEDIDDVKKRHPNLPKIEFLGRGGWEAHFKVEESKP